ncbi:amino-acid N-acetyltransferase [Alkalimarinus alittae]|uniref:Amino-acid acetyltransferase n=1 Tax=Alkalimarinus alittae TaxID=2961619 RepID=A0ABY6N0U1_9ALTE|nr:amino-acid N-acetyltransferase [Alkalimarinus alittae]UZE95721.1 amino-acid N-acetyltransferase [Alkalimarinus alittae]
MSDKDWVNWFRQSSPYINAHRKKTVVLTLCGEALADDNLTNIVHDITLLNSLGVRLVIAFGARPQIDSRLAEAGIESEFHLGLRVTHELMLEHILEVSGRLRATLEAKLSMGVVNSPMHGAKIRVCSGNFVMARPVGVLEGTDLCHTGKVRRIDSEAIETLLDSGAVVVLPSLGYSVTGDAFNLSYEDVASATAVALKAEKLILLIDKPGIVDSDNQLIRELTIADGRALLGASSELDALAEGQLRAACEACANGVKRAHIISYKNNGAILEELFTRDGGGTMVNSDDYEQVRPAQIGDLNGIMELIEPLEEQGVLVRRSRELIETEIGYFTVDERDGAIIGCAALYPFPEDGAGELSCFAVRADYRRYGRGDTILEVVEKRARAQGFSRLFVLTTQTEHWFLERGFEKSSKDDLPGHKQSNYNLKRNSKVFVKYL